MHEIVCISGGCRTWCLRHGSLACTEVAPARRSARESFPLHSSSCRTTNTCTDNIACVLTHSVQSTLLRSVPRACTTTPSSSPWSPGVSVDGALQAKMPARPSRASMCLQEPSKCMDGSLGKGSIFCKGHASTRLLVWCVCKP